MPAKGHGVCLRPGGEPQREDADHDAAEVGQKMGRVRHDGQAASSVSTCTEDK